MKHTNKLIHSSSPYLLQHAHNPVDWFPYGPEALAKAKIDNKPILISIGYSACHWCHVMERESFENEQVAEYMNAHFICIKVDREERPDIDQVYMDAVQIMTGSGGWPLNVFCTPDAKPFYGGTYFPPINAYNRASWFTVLESLVNAWLTKENEVIEYAENMLNHLNREERFYIKNAANNQIVKEDIKKMSDALMSSADLQWGGFGGAPKFPAVPALMFLLTYHFYYNEPRLKVHVMHTVRCMIRGGIYDHLEGGFARYSTDKEWLVPHFEKMLYDNALLLILLCACYKIDIDGEIKDAIIQTTHFCLNTLKNTEGGFYCALDADSEGEEGKYYTWSIEEVHALLGADADTFIKYYNLTETGHLDGLNILHENKSVDDFCKTNNLEVAQVQETLLNGRLKLKATRDKRIPPGTDDKMLLGWNALMCSALCQVFTTLGAELYKQEAINAMQFIISRFKLGSGKYAHTYKSGSATLVGYLDDLAFLIDSLINVYSITGDSFYLKEAFEVTEHVLAHFGDDNDPSFYYTPDYLTDIVIRKKEFFDNATPSGNSYMLVNLQKMAIFFKRSDWASRADSMLDNMKEAVLKFPSSFGVWANALLIKLEGTKEVVCTGKHAENNVYALQSLFLPQVIWAYSKSSSELELFAGKPISEDLIYVCENLHCLAPIKNITKAINLLLPKHMSPVILSNE